VHDCEQLHAEAHCHEGAVHRMSAFHTFCSEWTDAFIVSQYTCGLLLHEFGHPYAFPIPENSCHELSGRQTTFV
jgi:hypothetical protein